MVSGSVSVSGSVTGSGSVSGAGSAAGSVCGNVVGACVAGAVVVALTAVVGAAVVGAADVGTADVAGSAASDPPLDKRRTLVGSPVFSYMALSFASNSVLQSQAGIQ